MYVIKLRRMRKHQISTQRLETTAWELCNKFKFPLPNMQQIIPKKVKEYTRLGVEGDSQEIVQET